MAQHLEIGKAGFDIVFNSICPDKFRDNPCYKRVPFQGGKIYLNDINTFGGGGLKSTEFVLCYKPKGCDETYEIHFNYRNKVLKVYLVM